MTNSTYLCLFHDSLDNEPLNQNLFDRYGAEKPSVQNYSIYYNKIKVQAEHRFHFIFEQLQVVYS